MTLFCHPHTTQGCIVYHLPVYSTHIYHMDSFKNLSLFMFMSIICTTVEPIICTHIWHVIRGRTDKKLTSTLVIRTFLSFELADIFYKYGSLLLLKTDKKTGNFHPQCQRRSKHNPLDPERHHYAVSPPERLDFLVL